jgi:glucose-1-phosphatase
LKPRAIVFDLGKVLLDFDYGIAARTLAGQSTASVQAIRALIDQSPLLLRYESAGINSREFFDEVREQIKYRGTYDQFSAAFGDIFAEIPEMIALHDDLQAQNIPTFVLSNTNEIAIGHIRARYPFFNRVRGLVLSYEHAVMKPQPRIYEIVEATSGCRAGELLFIDDRAENVEGAAARGWKAILHRTPGETVRLVRAAFI